MEFEDLSEQVQWECRRVAAAFGVQEIVRRGKMLSNSSCTFQGRRLDGLLVVWTVSYDSAQWQGFYMGLSHKNACHVDWIVWPEISGKRPQFRVIENPEFHKPIACALYRLGFEDEGVLTPLNAPLSMHEKLELRLSMPREFWPQKWLDEEAKSRE